VKRGPVVRTVIGAALAIGLASAPAGAQDPTPAPPPTPPTAPPPADRPLSIRWSFKTTGMTSDLDHDALWRFRVEPTWRLGPGATFESAYEQRLRFASSGMLGGGLGLGVLPSEAPPPYRLTPLDWEIASGEHAAWRHEIDRAALRAQVSRVEITAGRQAVGWGRGVLFGAIDLFAPFSPFEADREWRRGIDAVRADVRLSSRASGDFVAAFGERSASSAYVGRLRGYAGNVDVEAAAGRRGRDGFAGAASSFVIGNGEMHVEAAAFWIPAVPGSAIYAEARTVTKVVVGGSSRVPIGNGIVVYVEYHYSGFGVTSADRIPGALTDPAFVGRLYRGDTQILTRHALAVVASHEWSPIVAASTSVVQEPTDGSGVVTPSITLTFGDRWSLLGSAYLSYGRHAENGVPQSAYGSARNSAVVQLRFYR
jgi:hypothetical protein